MTLLSVQAARERILSQFEKVETEILPLSQAAGRILAVDVYSPNDLPPFDNSSVDGFAVIADDLKKATADSPAVLKVVADIRAGSVPDRSISRGQAARIMTGAVLPDGANAVIMIEDTDSEYGRSETPLPSEVKSFRSIAESDNIRPRGMDIKNGLKVLSAGDPLRPQAVGLLAMMGVGRVEVYRKPLVALFSSGDELIPIDRPPQPGKIRDSNSYILSALLAETGCATAFLGIAPDSISGIRQLLDHAVDMHADLIISSAGVSVGAFDYLKEIIQSDGALDFWRVNMRPGKPLAFGEYRGIRFIGLPGNPVSAFVGFQVLVRPALGRLAGLRAVNPFKVPVRLAEGVESDGRESYLRAIVNEQDGVLTAKLTGHQGSGNLLSLVQANALLIIPAGVKSLAIGAQTEAWLL
jgi:molybdopterin molybdotransferase